jgi:hypothetical protein
LAFVAFVVCVAFVAFGFLAFAVFYFVACWTSVFSASWLVGFLVSFVAFCFFFFSKMLQIVQMKDFSSANGTF